MATIKSGPSACSDASSTYFDEVSKKAAILLRSIPNIDVSIPLIFVFIGMPTDLATTNTLIGLVKGHMETFTRSYGHPFLKKCTEKDWRKNETKPN